MFCSEASRPGRALCAGVFSAIITGVQISAATLMWDYNPEPDIGGYRVFYGETNTPPTMVDVGNTNAWPLAGLSAGKTYYFYLTAYNTANLESDPSETIIYTVPPEGETHTPPVVSNIPDQTISYNSATAALTFTISDAETAAEQLQVTASSSNQALIPNANLALSGTGSSRQLVATPARDQLGSATVTVSVSDGEFTTSDTFVLNVVNYPPAVSAVSDQTINEDTASAAIAFVVQDRESTATQLVVTSVSSNPSLISSQGIALGGSGSNRTVTVRPATNQFGSATITLTVSDGRATAVDQFVVTVRPVNDLPVISNIRNRTIPPASSTGPLAFTIGDVETAAQNLVVDAWSSNPWLVPQSGIALAGSGASRSVTVTPAPLPMGSAVITVRVSDGAASVQDTFTLTVAADAPTLLLNEGFEPAGYENSGWSEVGDPDEDYSASPVSDTQSLRSGGGQQIYRVLGGIRNIFLYAQVRWEQWSGGHSLVDLMSTDGSTLGFIWASPEGRLGVYHKGSETLGGTLLHPNTTYNLWLDWSAPGFLRNGTISLYVSPSTTRPSTPEVQVPMRSSNDVQRVYFGAPAPGPILHFDNICLDDVPIGSNPAY